MERSIEIARTVVGVATGAATAVVVLLMAWVLPTAAFADDLRNPNTASYVIMAIGAGGAIVMGLWVLTRTLPSFLRSARAAGLWLAIQFPATVFLGLTGLFGAITLNAS